MNAKQVPWVDELSNFYKTALFELPSAAAKMMFEGDEKRFRAVGWKAYDSWVRLANETANRLYSNPAFSAAAGRTFEAALGFRRLNAGLMSATLAALWPALDLPIAMEVRTTHDEAIAPRQEPAALFHEPRSNNWTKVAKTEPSREISFATDRKRDTSEEASRSMKAA